MILNLKLEGVQEEIVTDLVDRGIAASKSEAIRMMILHYNEHFKIRPLEQEWEDELAVKRMEKIDKEIKQGKRRTMSAKEAMGEKYSKMLE